MGFFNERFDEQDFDSCVTPLFHLDDLVCASKKCKHRICTPWRARVQRGICKQSLQLAWSCANLGYLAVLNHPNFSYSWTVKLSRGPKQVIAMKYLDMSYLCAIV